MKVEVGVPSSPSLIVRMVQNFKSEFGSCVKVEVTALGSPSLTVHTVQNSQIRAQELCESRGGRPGLPVPNSPYSLCGREATMNSNSDTSIFFRFLPALLLSLHPTKELVMLVEFQRMYFWESLNSVFFIASCSGQSVYTSCLKCDL